MWLTPWNPWKSPTKPPKPNVVRKEAYRVFEAEYWWTIKKIRDNLLKRWVVLNSIENVMKATRILDAMKALKEE